MVSEFCPVTSHRTRPSSRDRDTTVASPKMKKATVKKAVVSARANEKETGSNMI